MAGGMNTPYNFQEIVLMSQACVYRHRGLLQSDLEYLAVVLPQREARRGGIGVAITSVGAGRGKAEDSSSVDVKRDRI